MPLQNTAEIELTVEFVAMDQAESQALNVPPSAPILRALAAMALGSKRHQAELGVALQRAGLSLPEAAQATVLAELRRAELIEHVIQLDDGGVLLSVTSAGMQRAAR